MRLRNMWILPVCLLLLAGSPTSGTAQNKDTARDVASDTAEKPKTTVKLLDAGAKPRTKLRYKFQAGRKEKMVMEVAMGTSMDFGGRTASSEKYPVTQTTVIINSKKVTPEGDLRYDFELVDTKLLKDDDVGDGALDAVFDAMEQQSGKMKGLRGSATVTPRGFTRDAQIKVPEELDPRLKGSIDSLKQTMDQLSMPLPKERVGKGARWEVTMPMDTSMTKTITHTTTYTITEIDGDTVKMDVAIKQSAVEQETDISGVKVLMKSLDSSGSGRVELKLTDVVPNSSIDMNTTMVMSAGDQKLKTTMKIGTKIHP